MWCCRQVPTGPQLLPPTQQGAGDTELLSDTPQVPDEREAGSFQAELFSMIRFHLVRSSLPAMSVGDFDLLI